MPVGGLKSAWAALKQRPGWGSALLLWSAGMVVLTVLLWPQLPLPADDAFIHLRIARNLRLFGLPYYELGAPVNASSSPLWTVLLALAGADLRAAQLLSVAGLLGGATAAALVLAAALPVTVAVAAALLLSWMVLLPVSGLLMETPPALVCWLLSLWAVQRDRWATAGLLAGLALLLRYEFLLWLPVLLLISPDLRARRVLLAGMLPLLLLLLGWSLFWFGDVVPQSIRAKSVVYDLNWTVSLRQSRLPTQLLLLVAALTALALLLPHAWRRSRAACAALLFGAGLAAAYLLRATFIFDWYRPLYLLPLAVGCLLLLPTGGRMRAVALLLLLWTTALSLENLGRPPAPAIQRRVQQYLLVGADLARDYPQATMMTSEIGALGWAFGGRVIDAVGLVSPQVLRYHPLSPADGGGGAVGAIPPQAVHDLQPDLIVSIERFSSALRRDLADGSLSGYTLLRRYPVTGTVGEQLWRSQWIEVYRRDSLE
jgi:hypothetical protein